MGKINPSDSTTPNPANQIRLRWTYIILPLAFLALSIVLAAVFYGRLSPQIAYHFNGAKPDRFLNRGAFIGWMIAPQFLFTLLSFLFVRIILLGARFWPADSTPLLRLLPVMGNMLAIAQIIIFIAMLQFFLYNVYNIKPFPLWIIAIIILALGGIILGIIFAKTIRQAKQHGKIDRE